MMEINDAFWLSRLLLNCILRVNKNKVIGRCYRLISWGQMDASFVKKSVKKMQLQCGEELS